VLLVQFDAPTWAISLSSAIGFMPCVFLAPFSGVIVDKFHPYKLLLIFMAIESASVILLVLVRDMSWFWFLQLLIFIRMGAAGVYFQVEMSLLPQILTKDELKMANEIHSVIWAISYALGMGLSGLYIHFFGVYSSFVFDFVLLLVGIGILLQLRLSNLAKKQVNKATVMIKEGLKYLFSEPNLMKLILIHSVVGITTYDAIIALMAKHQYSGLMTTSLIIGFINLSRAIALIIGPVILSKFLNNKTVFHLFLAQGIALMIWGVLQHSFYFGLFGMFLAGFCISSIWAQTYTMIQNATKKEFYGRVVAYVDMVFLVVSALTAMLVGVLFDCGFSMFAIIFLMGAIFILSGIYYKFAILKHF